MNETIVSNRASNHQSEGRLEGCPRKRLEQRSPSGICQKKDWGCQEGIQEGRLSARGITVTMVLTRRASVKVAIKMKRGGSVIYYSRGFLGLGCLLAHEEACYTGLGPAQLLICCLLSCLLKGLNTFSLSVSLLRWFLLRL